MRIWRVEHKESRLGPYCSDGTGFSSRLADAHASAHTHPTWMRYGYRSAFSSLELLQSWFDGWMFMLHERGFVIQEYEIDETKKVAANPWDDTTTIRPCPSGKQLLFRPEHAEKIVEHEILALAA